MEDIFTILLQNQESIEATTWCDGQWGQVTIANGSRLLNPLQCGIYSPYNLFFRGVDVRADNEKRTGKLLNKKINSGGLEVTIEPNEVENVINATLQAHNEEASGAVMTGYSTTTYILMGLGGLFGAVVVLGGLGAAIRERVVKGVSQEVVNRIPQLEMAEEANIPARKGQLEIEFRGDAFAVEHYENRDVKRKINLVIPKQ